MEWVLIGVAYVAGSIPFGFIIGKAHGIDIRNAGSRNIGATNVARTCGKAWGGLTLVLDAGKGFGPCFVALGERLDAWFVVAIGAAAFVGHLFPVFLGFRGGKGVATALGVFVAIAPVPAAIGFGVYAVVFAATRTSSLGSLAGAVALPVATAVLASEAAYVALSFVLSAVVFVRHRDNIRRLLARKETPV